MTTKKTSLLSCNQVGSESFLSCALRPSNKLLRLRRRDQKKTTASKLSCQNDNVQEPQANTEVGYRALPNCNKFIIAIDPGITGAIAILSLGQNSKFITVFDMPTILVKRKQRLDLPKLSDLIQNYSQDVELAAIEEVGQIHTNADPFSSFVFGFATGALHGILSNLKIKITTIKPLVWKAALGLSSKKEESLERAKKLYPESASFLTRKKDHGRAEAILIGHFTNSLIKNSDETNEDIFA